MYCYIDLRTKQLKKKKLLNNILVEYKNYLPPTVLHSAA